jgi:thiamine transport system permease protein
LTNGWLQWENSLPKDVKHSKRATFAFWLSPAFVLSAITCGLVPLVTFAWQNSVVVLPDTYAWRVLRFTVLQATASTLLSVVPAIFIARALVRQRFFGRDVLVALFAVPLSLPVIVGVFGLTALYGSSGWFGGMIELYGLSGILLAHVFFNLPLAVRLLMTSLQAAPVESHRLASQLQFSDAAVFRHVDWPVLRPALTRVAALVFLLCASSFVIVLVLGGAKATTLEVAIYQSLRMDFDVPRALTLTVIQVALSGVLVWAAAKALVEPQSSATLRIKTERYDGKTFAVRFWDFALIAVAAVLVVPVLLSVFAQGLMHISFSAVLFKALLTSLLMACLSCCIALPLAWGLAMAQSRLPHWRGALTAVSLASFIVPPAVLATGWFLAFQRFDNTIVLAVLLIAIMNALMAMPFILSVLAPAFSNAALSNDRLCAQLGLSGWTRFTVVDLPSLRLPVAQALMLAFVLSMGDLTAVTLLGAQGLVTLPNLVQQQMGHYQSDAAGGTALILAAICLTITGLAQRFSRWT